MNLKEKIKEKTQILKLEMKAGALLPVLQKQKGSGEYYGRRYNHQPDDPDTQAKT